jgi:MFS transporter, UMF1 family
MEVSLKAKAGAVVKVPIPRRERWAWYLYDFGNSAYAAVILMTVYSAYFKNTVVGGADGSRLWGLSVSIAMLFVAISTPILGVIADFSRSKKHFLTAYTGLVIAFTASLFFVHKGDVAMGMVFFILAEIGYRSAQVFYNALLPEIAAPEEMGTISGNGWAIGSLGGIVALVLVLVMVSVIKIPGAASFTFIMAAVFFLFSSLPIFFWVKERAQSRPMPAGENYLTGPFKQLWRTFRAARKYKEFVKFIFAFMIFNTGIIVTFDFASIIGSVLFGLNQQQLVLLMMIVSITSVIGAYLFGIFTDRAGGKAALVVSLTLMVVIVSGLFVVKTLWIFYVIAAGAGFALTGVQSVSRMMVSMLAPHEQSAEFYGLFAVAGSVSAFIGPATYGYLADWGTHWFLKRGLAYIPAEQAGMRIAVISIIAFLVVGLGMLLFVKKNRITVEKTK